jgi:uncharacterized protein
MKLRRAAIFTMIAALVWCLLWGFWLEPRSLRVQEIALAVGWPPDRPLRIAVLSDLHVGSPLSDVDQLADVVARTNATQPDLICLLGDLVTAGLKWEAGPRPEAVVAQLARLQAPAGVVAVLGNHDHSFRGARVAEGLARAGIRVLEDTAVRLVTPSGPVWIAGVSDFWEGQHDVKRALQAVTDSQTPIIVITHNPDIFPEVPDRVMLTLAGHTHGGQVRLPLIGAPIVPSVYGQRYVAGHVIEGGRHLFVSTGIGTSGIPVRFGVPPTIFVLTLRRESRAKVGRR